MPRKKKETPNRKDNLYEVKVTIGKNFTVRLSESLFTALSAKKTQGKKQISTK